MGLIARNPDLVYANKNGAEQPANLHVLIRPLF